MTFTVVVRSPPTFHVRSRPEPSFHLRALPRVVPADGDDGEAATIAVGTVTTLPNGSPATVVNVGTPQDAILNFGIPEGGDGGAGQDGLIVEVVAGSNITVDNTDPARPVIASTASGSGDMEASVYDPQNIADDAFDRANHTGTQTASTISDFSTAADARVSAAIGSTVQAYSTNLAEWSGINPSANGGSLVSAADYAAMRALLNVEDGADVTDAANVDAAGAVMNSDTSTSGMSFVVDEDNMASNSATKVPTQQSVKAYVDALDAFDIDYTNSLSGAVARTVGSRLDDTINVKDFGAVGDAVTDDQPAVQAAIDACPAGGVVFFPAGRYRLFRSIEVPPRITLQGVQSQFWPSYSVNSSLYSAIVIPFSLFEDDFLVRLKNQEEGSYSIASSGQAFKDLIFYANDALNVNSDPVDCFYATGDVVGVLLDRVTIYQWSGNGIHTDTYEKVDTTKVHPKGWLLNKVSIQGCEAHNILHANTAGSSFAATDMQYDVLWLSTAGGDGIHAGTMTNTTFSGVRSQFNVGNGYFFNGNSTLRFVNCDSDRNGEDGFHFECEENFDYPRRLVFTGCIANRDGSSGSGFSGFRFEGGVSDLHIPVVMTGCATGVGRNDDGTGSYSPYYGVSVVDTSQVSLAACSLNGTVAALLDADKTAVYDKATRFNTTNPSTGVVTLEAPSPGDLIAQWAYSGTVSSIPFTDIPAKYSKLLISIDGLSHNSGSSPNILLQVSTNNGSSYDTTAAHYTLMRVSGTTWVDDASGGIAIGAAMSGTTTLDAIVEIDGHGLASFKKIDVRSFQDASGSITRRAGIGGYYGAEAVVNALRLITSTAADFDAGSVKLWGIK